MHFGVNIQSGKKRIERARGSVHHERVIEALMRNVAFLALDVAILFVNLRGLRETGLLLVNRLRHEDTGIFGPELEQERRAVLHHRDELLVAHPSRVKKNVVAKPPDRVDHLAGVVDCPVVSAQLDHGQAEGALFIGLLRGHFANQAAQVFFVEAVCVNPADKAVGIAGCFQVNGGGACLQESPVVVGLMVVAVKKHQVARR